MQKRENELCNKFQICWAFKILTLMEFEVVQLKPKLNFAKSHTNEFQFIPLIWLSLIHCKVQAKYVYALFIFRQF